MDQTIKEAAIIAEIAKRKPGVGRTAVMKYLYLIQTVKNIPLGYRFQLYTYGPYDTAVLSAIATARQWQAVTETIVQNGSGYGYEIEVGEKAKEIVELAETELTEVRQALDWAVEQFGNYKAGEMELVGTMVYADREAKEAGEKRTKGELVGTVLAIKPRFSREVAERIYDRVRESGSLVAAKP